MPIDLSRWPQPSDVEDVLNAAGLWPTSIAAQTAAAVEIGIAIPSAVANFERKTGWVPFLSGAADETRLFDATDERGLLHLEAGIVAVTSVLVAGESYVPNVNCWLRQSNAPAHKYPYDQIQFPQGISAVHPGMYPNQIAVTGRWGYCAVLPADVWDAVRQGAAAMTALRLTPISEGVIRTNTEDNARQSYDLGLRRPDRISEWFNQYNNAANHYERVVV